MVTGTVDLHEISRFHELVIYLRTDYDQPVIAVKSDKLEWWGDVRLSDLEVISGKLDSLDRMSIEQWVSAHKDDIAEAWRRYLRGETPDRIEPLPEDWPIGGPPPTRAISAKPLDGYRIWVEWEDGSADEIDLNFLAEDPAFAAWKDRRAFESVRIDGSCFTWGGDMEVCAWLSCWPSLRESKDNTAGNTAQ